MSNFAPVDFAGNPLLQPISFPSISYRKSAADRRFVNITGDRMEGDLDMGSHKITNLKSPTGGADAVNRGFLDAQIETVKRLLSKHVIEKVKGHQTLIDEIVKKTSDNAKAVAAKFLQLSTQLTSFKNHLQFKRFHAVLSNAKGISNYVFSFKDLDMTKNFVIVQIFIETLPGAWYNMYLLQPSYSFRVYTYKGKLFILSETVLPKDWTRKISMVYQTRQ